MAREARLGPLIRLIENRLKTSGNDNAGLDARLLVEAASGVDRAAIILDPDQILSDETLETIEQMVVRRLAREPVSKILGLREFYGREFLVNQHVLDPRPDTETLIDQVLAIAETQRDGSLNIVDLGTGSGAIAVTLACELEQANVVATDISATGLEIARANGERLGISERVRFVETNWADSISGKFDLVVSNPPYIETSVIETLDREVRDHDPVLALDGGGDGLDAYRQLADICPILLKHGGGLVVEIGCDQAGVVVDIFTRAGFETYPEFASVKKDLAGHDRVVTLMWP